jgi:uncharacterized cofD-like protein
MVSTINSINFSINNCDPIFFIMSKKKLPRIVCIGSKSSASLIVKGFSSQRERITAICPTTDSGSSTGIIRNNFFLPAPGDLRAIITFFSDLKGKDALLKQLFEYRFQPEESKDLEGMALGNLVIVALTGITGGFEKAIESASRLLKVKGKVLPVTRANTQLCAQLIDEVVVAGEVEVRKIGKPAIKRVFLEDEETTTTLACIRAIKEADLICLGPGCLYTSLIPCLLVRGINEAMAKTKGKITYICNHTTTPGQTDGFTVLRHVEEIQRYLKKASLDYCLITDRIAPPEMIRAYQRDMISFIIPTEEEIKKIKEMGIKPILSDFIERGWKGKRSLPKLDTIRHDPLRVRAALMRIYREGVKGPRRKGAR